MQDLDPEREEFIEALAQRIGRPKVEVAFWWNQFCKHSLDWLINKERPVDMYFARLHISPYRADYKAILDRKRYHKTFSEPRLFDPDLFALYHRNGAQPGTETCIRMIELEHRDRWYLEALRVERARKKRLGLRRYAAYCLETIRRRIETTVHLYRLWMADAGRPPAELIALGEDGGQELVSRARRYRRRQVPAEADPFAGALSGPEAESAEDGQPEPLSSPDGALPAVRTVQPEAQELRDTGGLPDSSADGRAVRDGLLVRTGAEEPAAGELLAIQQNQGPGGLAERT